MGSIALGDASGEVLVEVRGNSALKAARFIGNGEELIVDAIGEGEIAGDLPGICGIDLGLVVAVVALIAGQLRQGRALGVVVEVGRNLGDAAQQEGERLVVIVVRQGARCADIGGAEAGVSRSAIAGGGAAQAQRETARSDLRGVVV